MRPKIAIPVPHSQKPAYVQRSLPQYTAALEKAGGEAVVIPLEASSEEIAKMISRCQAVLLPGSSADVDPQKYGAQRHSKTEAADAPRDQADELLLQDAYNLRKPILGICYGLQSLNVWRTGTLVQDIPSQLQTKVNHSAGREVAQAHTASIDPVSGLASILSADLETAQRCRVTSKLQAIEIPVNSSHHQSAEIIGDGLRAVARCPQDGVIEAVEGSTPGHFVTAVQWHPERGYDEDPASRALFRAFIKAAS